jgi:hypothetical protein
MEWSSDFPWKWNKTSKKKSKMPHTQKRNIYIEVYVQTRFSKAHKTDIIYSCSILYTCD